MTGEWRSSTRPGSKLPSARSASRRRGGGSPTSCFPTPAATASTPGCAAATQIVEYLEGERTEFDLPLDLRGTPFQHRVWEKLLEIPYGETLSYQEVARAVRRPRALRAVGNANGANPVSLVVPCHRVVASGGKLGGYAGGLSLKARLLAMERAHRPSQGCLL